MFNCTIDRLMSAIVWMYVSAKISMLEAMIQCDSAKRWGLQVIKSWGWEQYPYKKGSRVLARPLFLPIFSAHEDTAWGPLVLFAPFTIWGCSKKALTRHWRPALWSWTSQTPELKKRKLCYLYYLVSVFVISSINGLRQYLKLCAWCIKSPGCT